MHETMICEMLKLVGTLAARRCENRTHWLINHYKMRGFREYWGDRIDEGKREDPNITKWRPISARQRNAI